MENIEQFLNELTELSLKHGIAIIGESVLFIMEHDDQDIKYQIDGDSNLSLA